MTTCCRIILALLFVALLIIAPPTSVFAQARRPNVLFLIADDLNCMLGCYGDPIVKTPNIDRLAARGVRFERAYCQFPLCGPSRNSFLTGLYPNSTGIVQNSQLFRQTIGSHKSLPQSFRLGGYFAARIGKLYHYNVPLSIGTNGHDDPASWELEMNPAGCDRLEELPSAFTLVKGQWGGVLSWYASPRSDEHHTDAKQAADAEWVLKRCAEQKDRPFFLAVGFFRPHTPYISPKKYFDMYPAENIPLVHGVEEDRQDIPPVALAGVSAAQEKMDDDTRRQCRQAYYASISFMDAQVGRVLGALDRLGLADDTIVLMTSDHGYHMGEHGLWQKKSVFEESARVPLIIAAPGAAKGVVARSPVGLIDVYPTLTELCGIKAPGNIQGQSLAPVLKDPGVSGRGWALTQVIREGRRNEDNRVFGYSLRTPRWRYTEWDEGAKGRELYDHDADPRELVNLADTPAQSATVADLSQQLHAAIRTTFPPSGKAPNAPPTIWNPNLTNP